MPLNIEKCTTISFSMKKNTTYYDYVINKIKITRVNEINDLVVIFDSKLNFNSHVQNITNKAFSKLGFLKRACKDFHDEYTLKLLFFTLIRSHLEYAQLIWRSNSITQNHNISRVQNNFLRYLCFQCNVFRDPHSDYDDVYSFFSLSSLHIRSKILNLKFLYKLLNNTVDCPELIERLNFKIGTTNPRCKFLFYLPNIVKNDMKFSPSYILMSVANEFNNIYIYIPHASFRIRKMPL